MCLTDTGNFNKKSLTKTKFIQSRSILIVQVLGKHICMQFDTKNMFIFLSNRRNPVSWMSLTDIRETVTVGRVTRVVKN